MEFLKKKNYISHHGIKGQKWGIRRFQNEDGTLTQEGKRYYLNNLHEANEDRKAYWKEGDDLFRLGQSIKDAKAVFKNGSVVIGEKVQKK